jgi:hypothetical protein
MEADLTGTPPRQRVVGGGAAEDGRRTPKLREGKEGGSLALEPLVILSEAKDLRVDALV